NQQVAAVAPAEDIAAVADQDVVTRTSAAGDVLNVGDAAPHAGGRVQLQVDDDVAGVRRVIQRVGAAPAVEVAGDACAVAEDEPVVGRATDQVLHGGEGHEAGDAGAGQGPGVAAGQSDPQDSAATKPGMGTADASASRSRAWG